MDVRLPNGKIIRGVPEGTPKDVIAQKAIRAGIAQPSDFPPIDTYATQAQEDGGVDNFLAGMGGAMVGMGLGAGQRLGLVDQAAVDEHRKSMEGLRSTKSGTVGEFAGIAVPVAATAAIPGANTYTGAAAVGALTGAVQPTVEGESAAANAALGAAGGLGGQYVGNKVAGWAGDKLADAMTAKAAQRGKNSVRDATIKEVQGAGYKVTPSQAGRKSVAESVSGKFKTNQAFVLENQKVTDGLVRKAIGLGETDEISREALKAIRNRAAKQGYQPVRSHGAIRTDAEYARALDDIAAPYLNAAQDFDGALASEIPEMIAKVKKAQFDSSNAVDMMRLLREQADKAFGTGDAATGRALREISKAIEDQIERALPSGSVLNRFREARQLMAKTFTIEDALDEATGQVDATKLGRMFQAGKPLSGELRTVGKMGAAFKDTARLPKTGDANPFTVFDLWTSGGAGAVGLNVSPEIAAALAVGMPLARVAGRNYLMSNMAQRGLAPGYSVPLSQKAIMGLLKDPVTAAAIRGAGPAGLLGQ